MVERQQPELLAIWLKEAGATKSAVFLPMGSKRCFSTLDITS